MIEQYTTLWVARPDLLVAEVEPVDDPRTEVLEHDVAHSREVCDELLAGVRRQIDGHATLAAVLLREVRRKSAHARLGRASQVALGRLDLDDVRAEVCERLATRRPGQHTGQIQHPDSIERPHRPGRYSAARGS